MNDEVNAYVEYLLKFGELTRPKMPKIDYSAYSDSEYKNAIIGVMKDYENVDDFDVTIDYLKGE